MDFESPRGTADFSDGSFSHDHRLLYVNEQIDKLGLAECFKEYPNLVERLAVMASGPESHFSDSAEMAQIFDLLWGELGFSGFDKKKMKLAALLHDIGKTGPLTATPEQQKIVTQIFDARSVKVNSQQASVREFIQAISNGDSTDILTTLQAMNLPLDINGQATVGEADNTGSMINFFRRHADWTYQILNARSIAPVVGQPNTNLIDSDVISVAASHHLLEGKNPAKIPVSVANLEIGSPDLNIIKATIRLTLVDQYHALRERADKTHRQAITLLKRKVKSKYINDEEFLDECSQILEVLDRNKKGLESIVTQSSNRFYFEYE